MIPKLVSSTKKIEEYYEVKTTIGKIKEALGIPSYASVGIEGYNLDYGDIENTDEVVFEWAVVVKDEVV